jgi:hypothetical protein
LAWCRNWRGAEIGVVQKLAWCRSLSICAKAVTYDLSSGGLCCKESPISSKC